MKRINKTAFHVFIGLLLFAQAKSQGIKDPVDYVNPYIGNISHLLVPTYPTVHLPNSMLRLVPDRADFTAPYLNSLPVFVTSHRRGSAFSIKPFSGKEADLQKGLKYHYDLEKTTPYSYAVYLEDYAIAVKLSPSHRSAIYTFTHENPDNRYYMVSTRNGKLNVSGNVVSGYSQLNGRGATAYVYMVFDVKPSKTGIFSGKMPHFGEQAVSGQDATLILSFEKRSAEIKVRYGVSFISVDQARKNLDAEIPDFDIDRVAAKGRAIWNEALGKIRVAGGSEDDKFVFYTALYRTYERMVDISEDGYYYSPFDGKVHADNGIDYFIDDWSWDTYRASHPLQLLINPRLETQKIASYIRAAGESKEGWMPVFPTITGDAHTMNGNHAVAIIWDGYQKGRRGFDLSKAYAYCRRTIMEETISPWKRAPAGALDSFYKENGYFPALRPAEKETSPLISGWEKRQAVAVTLAASYDDWCLSQMAKALGKLDDYHYFLKRAYNYRNLFNSETSFFHPKDKEGQFIKPFDYRFSGGIGTRDYYDENNGWTYRWDVQHNTGDLVKLMGGPEKFVQNLDQLFAEPMGKNKYEFYHVLPDQTGNVGQFTMGNEPSLHIPYLYNYAGAPWKTQKRVRSLMEMWFRNDLMGIPGDEDGGGLTSFAVFSSMGFYPVVGLGAYTIGSPIFNKISIDLGDGKQFVIEAQNCSRDNKYIQSAKLNGMRWDKPWFSHQDIINGAKLELVMGNHPNKKWGSDIKNRPPSAEPMP